MNVARPESFWLLGIVPLLLVWGVRSARLRGRSWEAVIQQGKTPGDGTFWWIAAVCCTIIALAQPKWGRDPSDRLPPGHDVVLLFDVSRSMGAEDAIPTRLGVAKESARSLIQALANQQGNRVAVVAFAGRGVLRCPLAENSGAALEAINRLKPGDVRPGGTDLTAGLATALDAFDRQEHEDGRTIVIFSDGEDHTDEWENAMPVDRFRRESVIVHTVAIGDPERGHVVPIKTAATTLSGKAPSPATTTRSLTYHGEPVLSRREDTALETVARRSGGTIIRLGLASADLGALYRSRIEPVAARTRAEMRIAERIDRFPLFLITALVMGLIGSWPRGFRRMRRHGWKGFWNPSGSQLRSLLEWSGRNRIAEAAGAVAIALTVAGADEARIGTGTESATRLIAKGLEAYEVGRFEGALNDFNAAIRREPTHPVPRYNAAAAHYRLGRYAEAYSGYLEAKSRAWPALRTKIDFALGNAALASGEIAAAIRHYDDCLASTVTGDGLDTVRRDAAINREFALEQAKTIGADLSQPRRPDSQSSQERGGAAPDRSQKDSSGSDEDLTNEANSDQGLSSPQGSQRRSGGAGGGGSHGKGDRDNMDSPDRRLDDAIHRIRDAQHRRLPHDDSPPDPDTQDDHKDW